MKKKKRKKPEKTKKMDEKKIIKNIQWKSK